MLLALGEVGPLYPEDFRYRVEVKEIDTMTLGLSIGFERTDSQRNTDRIPKVRYHEQHFCHAVIYHKIT